jgi:hypothetical protein
MFTKKMKNRMKYVISVQMLHEGWEELAMSK